jgi:hypothetical protein
VAELQAGAYFGATADWKLDPRLPQASVQEMRDRAYRYCLGRKAPDENCFREQDQSLFAFAKSFALVRTFRSEQEPTFPFAVAHQLEPAAFEGVRRYCQSVYEDAGSGDARSLGPCMSAAVGADFFGIVPVP